FCRQVASRVLFFSGPNRFRTAGLPSAARWRDLPERTHPAPLFTMTAVASSPHTLLDSLLSEDAFYPTEPRTLAELGVSAVLIESLACKLLLHLGTCSGREAAKRLCLPFPLLDEILSQLRVRQLVVHTGQAQLNDYIYRLTELGIDRA